MSDELRQAAADFEAHVKTALGPHMPGEIVRDVAKLYKMIKTARETALALRPRVDKAWGDLEELYAAEQKAFVARGNHPDDYMDTPEGDQLAAAQGWGEDMSSLLKKDSRRGIIRPLDDIEEHLLAMLKRAGKGGW